MSTGTHKSIWSESNKRLIIFVSYLENKGLCMHIPFYMNDLAIVVTTHDMF